MTLQRRRLPRASHQDAGAPQGGVPTLERGNDQTDQVRMKTRPPCQMALSWVSFPLVGAVREPPLQRTFQRGDDHQTLWEIALISHQRLRRGGASNSDRPSVTCAFSGGSAAEKPAAAMAASRPST